MASAAPELPVLARDRAFEALYRLYVKDVYHYALALLRNPADAEDVTQTTFLNAYRAYRRGDEIEKPQNWLIKIAHNVARSRYARAKRRVKEVPLEEHVDQLAVPEAERPNVEGVLRALGRLPFNQRAALVMRELEGRSYAEIAETIGVSVPAVETLIFRARRSLRVRASELRSLGTVPLPKSLTQLFGGGGAVATGGAVIGGAAVIGSGLIAKATVALIAGVVATGVSWTQIVRATTAPSKPAAQGTVTHFVADGSRSIVQGNMVRTVGGASPNDQAASIIVGGSQGTPFLVGPPHGSVLVTSATAPGTTGSVPTVVAQTASAVTTAVQTATNPTAGLPVPAPGVPSLPVQLPNQPPRVQIPSLPAPLQIPSLPTTPEVPSIPTTEVPTLPPPLQVPTLPSLTVDVPPVPSLP